MRTWRFSHLILCAMGGALGAFALYVGFPEPVALSPSTTDGPTISLGDAAAAFLLPIAALTTDVLLRGLIARHPIETAESNHILPICDAIMLRVVSFLMGLHVVVLAARMGMFAGRPWASRIVPVMLGMTMMGVGNLLPRTRRNLAIGIRTSRTLSDRAVWMQTHRLVGPLVVIGGLMVVCAALAVPAPIGPTFALGVGPAVLVGSALAALYSARGARLGAAR